jgi:gliding motility-associated-like protein
MKKLFIILLAIAPGAFAQSVNINGIINSYIEITGFNPCTNALFVNNSNGFNAGDTVLLIQMKGADIIATNTINYGDITSYNNAGNYELNYVSQKTPTSIVLRNILTKPYYFINGAVQLIKVPYYKNVAITDTLSCLPWDGGKGGVVVLNVADTLELFANIDVSEKGFLGGGIGTGFICNSSNWANGTEGAFKGEGIAAYTQGYEKGGAHLANGGGGSFSANSGGGGGGNYGAGGIGGKEYISCSTQRQSIGGSQLDYTLTGKIFAGGGGGGGEQDNGFTVYPGGNGGGIIIIRANIIKANNNKIKSNGQSVTNVIRDEGGSGGGAGGSIVIFNNTYINNLNVEARGGDGNSNNNITYATQCHGPGAGGGGGIIALSNASLPANVLFTATGGLAGKVLNPVSSCFNTTHGAANGNTGGSIFNQILPAAMVLFKRNIDSVRIKDSATSCTAFSFKGLGFTNISAITGWQWDFGDGNTANIQNTNHTYTGPGIYLVKLLVTDANNCKDSISKTITVSTVYAGADTMVCKNAPFSLHGIGTGIFAWTPKSLLNDSTLQNPTAIINNDTTFYLTVTNALGCTGTDSVNINLRPAALFNASTSLSGCSNTQVQLNASGGNIYLWSPSSLVSNPAIPNPFTLVTGTQLFTVKIKESTCNDSVTLNTLVTVKPAPPLTLTKSNDITCSVGYTTLTVRGAGQYSWSPAGSLNNATGSSVVAAPLFTTTYIVNGTDANGCVGLDSVTVLVNFTGKANYFMPNSFTPNGDGVNDCYGIKYFGLVQEFQLIIFNRWGEKVFATSNPNFCWDGTHNGTTSEAGNYIYHLKAVTACGPVENKGNLLLLR